MSFFIGVALRGGLLVYLPGLAGVGLGVGAGFLEPSPPGFHGGSWQTAPKRDAGAIRSPRVSMARRMVFMAEFFAVVPNFLIPARLAIKETRVVHNKNRVTISSQSPKHRQIPAVISEKRILPRHVAGKSQPQWQAVPDRNFSHLNP